MRRFLSLAGVVLLSACAIGDPAGVCEQNPEGCVSASEMMGQTNGVMAAAGGSTPQPLGPLASQKGLVPPNTDAAALERGDVMRIWTAPYQDERGALHVSGYTFIEMRQRAWDVSSTDFYWTGR